MRSIENILVRGRNKLELKFRSGLAVGNLFGSKSRLMYKVLKALQDMRSLIKLNLTFKRMITRNLPTSNLLSLRSLIYAGIKSPWRASPLNISLPYLYAENTYDIFDILRLRMNILRRIKSASKEANEMRKSIRHKMCRLTFVRCSNNSPRAVNRCENIQRTIYEKINSHLFSNRKTVVLKIALHVGDHKNESTEIKLVVVNLRWCK